MEYFSAQDIGRVFVLRLDPGEYIVESLQDLIAREKIQNGVVVSGIGTFSDCILHMVTTTGLPPKEYFAEWKDKALELASIQGVIADAKPHLHAVISDRKKAVAGHLEEKTKVLYLAELVILEFKGLDLTRIKSDKGLSQLVRKT